jgi:hypothetical protein
LSIPTARLRESSVARYRAKPAPRAMLGGLLLRQGDAPERRLKDLYFSAMTSTAAERVACAASDGWDVVSLYAPRTQTRTVLARPDWDVVKSTGPHGTFRFPLVGEAAACSP